jgi:hypothetical protein
MDQDTDDNSHMAQTDDSTTLAATITQDTAAVLIQQDEDDDCLFCPICKDLLIMPRLYSCGHNVCEECMILADKATEDDVTHTAPIYKCPLCRDTSLQKWYDRPVNNALIDVLCKICRKYQVKHNGHEKRIIADVPSAIIPKNVNLARISKYIREYRTECLYRQIVPILYRAALAGKSYVTITSTHEIGTVADMLAKRLIERNGIYRFITGHRECQIELVPSDRSYRCDFENEHYNTDTPILINNSAPPDIAGLNNESGDNVELPLLTLQPDENAVGNEITGVDATISIHDIGTQQPDQQSRELSSFLVTHILRNLTQTNETLN